MFCSLIPSHPLDSSFIRPLHLFAAGENGKIPTCRVLVHLPLSHLPPVPDLTQDLSFIRSSDFRLFFSLSLRQPLSSRETKGEEDEADGLTEYVAGIARLSSVLERRLNKAALSFSPSDRPGTGRSSLAVDSSHSGHKSAPSAQPKY